MTIKEKKLNTVVKMKTVGISTPINTNLSIANNAQSLTQKEVAGTSNVALVQNISNVTEIEPQQGAIVEDLATMNLSAITKKVSDISANIQTMKQELNTIFLERKEVIDDIFNCLIANQNILLLGPPGTGKSALAESITSRITSARIFKWLLNRTSDPSEILGPISIRGMEQDRFIRKLDGKIADCEVAFLDEIFKCNEPTLNALLPIMNEKIIYNDGKAVPIPLKMVIAASNETPEDEELGALYDRILIKHYVDYIKDPGNKEEMIKRYNGKAPVINNTSITLEDLNFMQDMISKTEIPDDVLQSYGKLINEFNMHGLHFSDRKINWATDLIKAKALSEGRITCSEEDLIAIAYAFWENQDDISYIKETIGKMINPDLQFSKELYNSALEILNQVEETYNQDNKRGTEECIEAKQKLDLIAKKISKIEKKAKSKKSEISAMKKEIIDKTALMIQSVLNINTSVDNSSDAQDLPF